MLNASMTWDHPRVSGEHTGSSSVGPVTMGSSPRERGARGALGIVGNLGRIIPA